MDTEVAQFILEGETKFLIDVREPEGVAVERAALNSGQLVIQAKQTFEEAMSSVMPVASKLLTSLKTGLPTQADEVEIKFGLRLSAEAGAIFTSVGGDVNFEITLKWKEDKAG